MHCVQPDSWRESKPRAAREGTAVCALEHTLIKEHVVTEEKLSDEGTPGYGKA